ncbi:hypothetical protein CCZ01_02390 [Helicobacter monodelphidis]|uniref:YggT family protein n=1 Tax=Helicobacter sp. 15-1451 TaxID=2004995 RepID=UPI000DCE2CB6|nr:YggT family protein [Helicobacter sp. 15-1451]RAX58692.1 hypothetical protein CCZ01_02390 [Helicobacter sp. 15-1451]
MVFDSLIVAVISTISILITTYTWIVVISALLSWVRPDPYNPIVQILRNLTEPVYNWIRTKIPTNFAGLDIAPLIVIIALQFINTFITYMGRSL